MSLPVENEQMIERGVALVLEGLGCSLDSECFRDTPRRVAKLCSDCLDRNFCSTEDLKLTTFEDADHDGTGVQIVNMPFFSFCAHHLLPFHGAIHMAYVPGKKIAGLSKLPRLARYFTKCPSTQEQITAEVVQAVMDHFEAEGAAVLIEAEHMCMSLRGVRTPGAKTITKAFRGCYSEPAEQQQFVQQCMAFMDRR